MNPDSHPNSMANAAIDSLPSEAVKQGGWYVLRTPPAQLQRGNREEKETTIRPPPVLCDPPISVPRPPLRAHPAMRSGGASKPIKAWLSYYSANSGAANTAFSTGFRVQPNQDTSWGSWQDVFDEFRVTEVEAIWNTYYTTDPTTLPANSANTIMVYDPTTTITLTSVNAGLQFEKYALCRCMVPTSSGPKVSPMVQTKDGFVHFRAKVPKGTLTSAVDTLNSGSDLWRPTGDASNYNYGNLLCYTSVGGVSGVLRVECFVRMLVEFRTRR